MQPGLVIGFASNERWPTTIRWSLLSAVLLSCGPAPLPEGRWDQCPPAGVEPADCTLDRGDEGFSLTGDERVREQTLAVLDEICASPCTSIDALMITNGYSESPFATIEVWKPLRKLKRVDNLSIQMAKGLKDLRGLESLTSVGTLELEDLPDLESLAGLENLERIEGSLQISYSGIRTLDGMPKVSRIGKDVLLQTLPNLVDISTLEKVVVGANDEQVEAWSSSAVALRSLRSLTTLGRAFSQQAVLGNLAIRDNAALADLEGFTALRKLVGISITDNGSLPICKVTEFVEDLDTSGQPTTARNGGSEGCP